MKKIGKLVGICNCQCHCGLKECFTDHDDHCQKEKIFRKVRFPDGTIKKINKRGVAISIKGKKVIVHKKDNL